MIVEKVRSYAIVLLLLTHIHYCATKKEKVSIRDDSITENEKTKNFTPESKTRKLSESKDDDWTAEQESIKSTKALKTATETITEFNRTTDPTQTILQEFLGEMAADSLNTSSKASDKNSTLFENTANVLSLDGGTLNLTIIPKDKLCLLCHLILKRFKEKISANPAQFKKDMISSCASLSDAKETAHCIEKVSDDRIKRISKTSVKELCIKEKLCKQDEIIMSEKDRAAPSVAPMDPIPELQNKDKEEAIKVEFSTRQQELLEMYTRE